MVKQRLGLALSGGGFRASFFHIGVLARMAELDMLRDLESISTVSGGSIIGAYYYLHLKQLLESKADAEITRQDYLDLVAQVEKGFLAAVQQNLRLRTFASLRHNMKMALRHYSRSDRIGELYDQLLYRPLVASATDDGVWMHDLRICPRGDVHHADFNPTEGHNDARRNKVPVLNINATVLNTGHNWRFTAVDMGEVVRSDSLALHFDKNTRLVKARYEDICDRDKGGFLLGQAVAASAGVPGVFPPLSVSRMYPWRIQLVDGGVYDNLGNEVLLNGALRCTHIIMSDASGQMRDLPEPDTRTLSVFMRTTDILMDRVREEMIDRVCTQHKQNVCLMHLNDGLDVTLMAARDRSCPASPPSPVRKDVTGKLSRIRTDLDSFTDVEATCLMARGYTLAQTHVDDMQRRWRAEAEPAQPGRWFFSQAVPWLTQPEQGPANLARQLDVAEQKFAKALRLGISPAMLFSLSAFMLGLGVYLAAIYFVLYLINPDVVVDTLTWMQTTTVADLGVMIGIALLVYALERLGKAFKLLRYLRQPYTLVVMLLLRFILPALWAIPIKLYLVTLDKYFLRQGRLG
ncbi:MAG: patatin-like phospholipase family protein [Gammaproteobacteria bacterium]